MNSILSIMHIKSFTPHTKPVKKSIPIDEEPGTLSQIHTKIINGRSRVGTKGV